MTSMAAWRLRLVALKALLFISKRCGSQSAAWTPAFIRASAPPEAGHQLEMILASTANWAKSDFSGCLNAQNKNRNGKKKKKKNIYIYIYIYIR